MRQDIERLIDMMKSDNPTAYRVHKDTGITQGQLARLKSGELNLDNLSLKNAEKLSNYYKEVVK